MIRRLKGSRAARAPWLAKPQTVKRFALASAWLAAAALSGSVFAGADGEEKGGGELVGNSKNTYNLGAYFENDRFNARLNYTYRSAFFNGLDRASAQHQAAVGNVSASLGWKISDTLTLSLDAMNLNNPVLKYYADNVDQPTAFYVNGRQYYLTLRAKI